MEGYDASDMAALLDRATLSAARRRLSLAPPITAQLPPPKPLSQPAALRGLKVHGPDLAAARQGFSPAAFWGVGRPVDATAGVQASIGTACLMSVSRPTRHCSTTLMAVQPLPRLNSSCEHTAGLGGCGRLGGRQGGAAGGPGAAGAGPRAGGVGAAAPAHGRAAVWAARLRQDPRR